MLICFPLVPGLDFWSFFSNAFGFCYEGKSYEDNVIDIKYMASPFIFFMKSRTICPTRNFLFGEARIMFSL